jgi:hypothetical protein
VDLTGTDLVEKFLKRRAIEARAGIALIVKLLLNDLETFADSKIDAQLALHLARGEIGFGPHRLAAIDGADTRPVNLGRGQLSSYSVRFSLGVTRGTLLTKAAC